MNRGHIPVPNSTKTIDLLHSAEQLMFASCYSVYRERHYRCPCHSGLKETFEVKLVQEVRIESEMRANR